MGWLGLAMGNFSTSDCAIIDTPHIVRYFVVSHSTLLHLCITFSNFSIFTVGVLDYYFMIHSHSVRDGSEAVR